METEPDAAPRAPWDTPPPQRVGESELAVRGQDRLTPIVGTAQPLRGLSGVLRRSAYSVPEHMARRWALLLVADRVDMIEGLIADGVGGALGRLGLPEAERRARAHPLGAAAALAGGLLLADGIRRALR